MNRYRGYSPEAAAWLEATDAIEMIVANELADIMPMPRAMEMAREMAPQLASSRLSAPAQRKTASSKALRPTYAIKALLGPGMGFCKSCRQPVRLKNAKTFRPSLGRTALIGNCPICGQTTYHENGSNYV